MKSKKGDPLRIRLLSSVPFFPLIRWREIIKDTLDIRWYLGKRKHKANSMSEEYEFSSPFFWKVVSTAGFNISKPVCLTEEKQ